MNELWVQEIIVNTLLVFLIATGWFALRAKDLLTATILLGSFSFFMCITHAALGAVDVAFTETAVGAGVSGVLMLATLLRTSRRTS